MAVFSLKKEGKKPEINSTVIHCEPPSSLKIFGFEQSTALAFTEID